MDGLLRDLRFAVRGLLRTPGFTAAAVLALALGIGATTAIFSVVHAVLMRSLGWGEETRLVSITTEFQGLGLHGSTLSVPEVMDLGRAPFLESFGAYSGETAALQGERAERVAVGYATSGFFRALGVSAVYGRTFAPEEDFKGKDGVALVSANAWRRRYGADPAAVGRSITLQGHPYVIVGILPEGFSYDGPHDFFVPFGFSEEQLTQQRGAHYLEAVGRLRPGVSLAAAQKGIAELGARVNAENPDSYASDRGFGFSLMPLRDRFVGSTRQPLLILFGAVLMVLLIACANVANLLLARSAAREHEFAVRAAIGAGRGRIVRQLLTEGLLLSGLGMVIGLLIAVWGLDALLAAAPRRIRELADARVDRVVLGFSMLLTVATTLVFALVPALRASRVDVASALKDGARGTSGAPATRLRSALVAAQMAVSLCLLAAAGLTLRSFAEVLRVSPGFDPEGVTAVMLYPAGPGYDEQQRGAGPLLRRGASRRFLDSRRPGRGRHRPPAHPRQLQPELLHRRLRAPPRRNATQQCHPARLARLLRHPAAADRGGQGVHCLGRRQGAIGFAGQRGVGAPLLPRPGRDRAPHPPRQQDRGRVAHDRGRGRRRPRARPRPARAARLLLRRRADASRPDDAGRPRLGDRRGGSRRRLAHRPDPAGGPRLSPRGGALRLAGAAPLSPPAPRSLRRAGVAPLRARHLRRHLLLGRAADARDRAAHGHRRLPGRQWWPWSSAPR